MIFDKLDAEIRIMVVGDFLVQAPDKI